MPCLVGRNEWDRQCAEVLISDFVSPSMEALGLWIIDNYSEKWSGGGKRTERAKYTSVKQGNKLFGGWNENGIERFNNLIILVRENRNEDNGDFEQKFRDICMDKIANMKECKIGRVSEEPLCCLDDLEDEDDCMVEQGVQHIRYLNNSVPAVIDVSAKSLTGHSIDVPDLSVASRNSTGTHTSSSRASLYGSIGNTSVKVRNRTVV